MIPISREISDLKSEFEGGASLAVDWYGLIRRGGESTLDHINPETLKRTVPIYGGLTRQLQVYYCPDDVEVPSRLYSSSDRHVYFDYMPPGQFYSPQPQFNYWRNRFTIEYINGVRFIVIRHPLSSTIITIDAMTELGTKTGVPLIVDTYNILPGASTSLRGTFSDTVYNVGDDLSALPLDISQLLTGITLVPFYVDDVSEVLNVELILTAIGGSYDFISTQDSVGDNFKDGQNMARFWVENATVSGSPDPTQITAWQLNVRMKTGKTQTVVLGKITIQKNALFFLEYYSNRIFIDGTTGAWKDTPVKGDLINLNRDALGILHYETARLVIQAATVDQVKSAESTRFDTELSRKYEQYYMRHPSSEQPLSYSTMADIAMTSDLFGDAFFGDFGDRVGNNSDSIQGLGNVNFADAEVPQGLFDDINTTFTLLHVPNPAGSLQLVLNGQTLILGVDYNLNANIVTFTSPANSAFSGLQFFANYRYTI